MVQIKDSRELYQTYVQEMPILERLQLVRLILDDLMAAPQAWLIDESDAWSDEDIKDLTRFSLSYAMPSLGEDDDA
ncbi:MAG: hypothetical protein Kow0063_10640 [Anaerolineae bacterium]